MPMTVAIVATAPKILGMFFGMAAIISNYLRFVLREVARPLASEERMARCWKSDQGVEEPRKLLTRPSSRRRYYHHSRLLLRTIVHRQIPWAGGWLFRVSPSN